MKPVLLGQQCLVPTLQWNVLKAGNDSAFALSLIYGFNSNLTRHSLVLTPWHIVKQGWAKCLFTSLFLNHILSPHIFLGHIFLFQGKKAGSWHNRIILPSDHLSSHTECLWVSTFALLLFLCFFQVLQEAAPQRPGWTQLCQVEPSESWTGGQRKQVSSGREMPYVLSMGIVKEVALRATLKPGVLGKLKLNSFGFFL